MKPKIRIAVSALVEYALRSGDLTFGFVGSSRIGEAIVAHRKVQKSRTGEYGWEVPVSHQVECRDFLLEVVGRIDGVHRLHDRVVIEEIKSTHQGLEALGQAENQLHWGQLKIYAFIYAEKEGLDEIDARLTYYQLDNHQTREFQSHFTRDDLRDFFQDVVAGYVEQAETYEAWRRLRDDAIRDLTFPFASYRPGQRRMAVEVYRAIQNREQMIVQAATGIGKTMATLFPALKAMAEGLATKVFYLTARTTGRRLAETALDELRGNGLKLKSLTLTAKDKICFHPERWCSAEECGFARGYYDRINGALRELLLQDTFTREAVETGAEKYNLCPFELSLELALWTDCIICDYNYVFDPKVYLKRFFLEEGGDYVFLIDEAHNLVDRSREMFSAEMRKQTFLEKRRLFRHERPAIFKSIGKINSRLVRIRKKCEEAGDLLSEKEEPSDIYPLLTKFLHLTEQWLSRNLKTPYREGLLELYFSVKGFMRVAEQYDESYATCFEKIGKDLRVKLFCIDPSGNLEKRLRRCRAAIFFSATMTPAHYFKKAFGCDDSARALELPSPFPENNFCCLIANGISTLYRQREITKKAVASMIGAIVKQKKGNYLLYFPSYEYMKMIQAEFAAEIPGMDMIVQSPGMTESERDAFLARFGEETHDTLVGFAVMGGIFGEGIDLVGDRLSGAVVVGVGLPAISPERELIRDYFARSNDAGFEFAYLYPGMNRVLQAAGRVIRSENDRGVALLIDQRFATSRYRSLFPTKWHPVKVRDEDEVGRLLKRFWKK